MVRPGRASLERTLITLPSLRVRGLTLVVALLFNLLPWPNPVWAPDVLGAAIVAWNLLSPGSVGLALVWVLGLAMDVQRGTPLGLYALSYCLLSFGSIALHRRLTGFSMGGRIAHVAGLFATVLIIAMFARMIMDGRWSLMLVVAQTALGTLLWVVLRTAFYRLSLRRRRTQRLRTESMTP